MYKCYFDASIRNGNTYISFVIISPNKKIVRQANYKNAITTDNIDHAERLAMTKLVEVLIHFHINKHKVLICGDRQGLIERINKKTQQKELKRLLSLLSKFQDCEIKWIPREENKYADKLSKLDETYKSGGNGRKIAI